MRAWHDKYCRVWSSGVPGDLTSRAGFLRQVDNKHTAPSDRTSFRLFYFTKLLQTPSLSHPFPSISRSDDARHRCACNGKPPASDSTLRPACDHTHPVPKQHTTTFRQARPIAISMRTWEREAPLPYPDIFARRQQLRKGHASHAPSDTAVAVVIGSDYARGFFQ